MAHLGIQRYLNFSYRLDRFMCSTAGVRGGGPGGLKWMTMTVMMEHKCESRPGPSTTFACSKLYLVLKVRTHRANVFIYMHLRRGVYI